MLDRNSRFSRGARLGDAERLRPWEIALALAVAAALVEGVFSPGAALGEAAATASWWTVMFPGLSELPAAGETVEVRWWIVELVRAVFGR